MQNGSLHCDRAEGTGKINGRLIITIKSHTSTPEIYMYTRCSQMKAKVLNEYNFYRIININEFIYVQCGN